MIPSRINRGAAAAIAVAVVALCVYYYNVDPAAGGTAPRCLLRSLTGYDCPGCGTQRALHALLHGHVATAWHHNAALFFAVPLAAAYAAEDYLPAGVARVLRAPAFILAIAAAIVAWWVLRNVA